MTPEQYCQDKVANSGSSFYYSFMALAENQRKAIIALYAFCREVDDVVDNPGETHIKTIKLQWWREEIARLFQQQAQHPVTRALTPILKEFDLAEEYFLEIIDGMEMDLNNLRYDSFKSLSLYCYRVASVVGLMAVEIFGYQDRHTLKYARDLGMAFQLTNILRDVHEDAQRGRIYLPAEDLEEFSVTEVDILNAKDSENFQRLMQFEYERTQKYYQQAFDHLPAQDRYRQRCGLIMAAIYHSVLNKLAKNKFPVFNGRIRLSTPHKLGLALRSGYQEWLREWRRRNTHD
ncbi:Phytoene synthase [hydrothermal vent metagenome]|uniref:Phytoene synthase n=1 Tax=hydrothermal vent metagenome TaxID=652676 RepID=A0A3B1B3A6_9ZZZZ